MNDSCSCASSSYAILRHYPFISQFYITVLYDCFSYVMVWMITVIGFTLGIPDTVMGLTFIAAGVSVPDCLSGVAVVKEGHGDMAISNAIGSNVFDILMCLGLPWFLKTCVISPGSTVRVVHKGGVKQSLCSVPALHSTVVLLIKSKTPHDTQHQIQLKMYNSTDKLWTTLSSF